MLKKIGVAVPTELYEEHILQQQAHQARPGRLGIGKVANIVRLLGICILGPTLVLYYIMPCSTTPYHRQPYLLENTGSRPLSPS